MYNPRVYVGTYKKYGNGSLDGGWVSLNDCNNYKEFLQKCRALHRGERTPEYMIQDCEDFPDGLDCMEWLSLQEFNDVKEACKETEKETEEEPDVALSPAERLRAALLGNLSTASKPKADNVPNPRIYKAWLEEFCQHSRWPDDDRKFSIGAVKLHDAYYLISKPRIENRFCFYDEGPDYEFYRELMADKEHRLAEYFKSQNLQSFDNIINNIENGTKYGGDKRMWWSVEENNSRRLLIYFDEEDATLKHYLKLCTDEDKAQILAAVKWGREMFEKRLDTYLKRYGVTNIHTWTFWADA